MCIRDRCRTVRFKRPNLHLTETLSAELRFTAKRLLRDKRVRTDGSRVDLVIDEVEQFHIVHDAYCYAIFERFALSLIHI